MAEKDKYFYETFVYRGKNFAAVKPRTINFPHHSFMSIERQNVLAIVSLKQIQNTISDNKTDKWVYRSELNQKETVA
jgi:hypothetical protein